jgi:hypothetical protein
LVTLFFTITFSPTDALLEYQKQYLNDQNLSPPCLARLFLFRSRLLNDKAGRFKGIARHGFGR